MVRGIPLPISHPHSVSAYGSSTIAPSALNLTPPNPNPGSTPVDV